MNLFLIPPILFVVSVLMIVGGLFTALATNSLRIFYCAENAAILGGLGIVASVIVTVLLVVYATGGQ